jgi:hypothetical protein
MDRIALKDIKLGDRRFAISYVLEDRILFDSVKAVGIIQPVVLLGGTMPVIVCGFKRIEAALKLGFETVPCFCLEVAGKDAMRLAIHDNLMRNLNTVEKAHIVERMEHFGFDPLEALQTMRLLGLQGHEKVRGVLMALADEGKEMKDFVVLRSPSLKSLGYLFRFKPKERPAILDTLKRVRTTESQLREILESMLLLTVRETPIDFGRLGDAETADDMRNMLKEATHPILTEKQRRLAALRTRYALPTSVDIRVDPFFEKEYIDITIRARHPEEVKEALNKLGAVADQGHVRSLLDLTKD